MSTTITPFTISEISVANSVVWVVLLTLLALLINKEAVSAATSAWAKHLESVLNIAIIPFIIVLVMLWGTRLVELLS
jgi:ABC-type methionine transport system permease subunit